MIDSPYPCIWFDGKAKEAADFYCDTFPNSKITAENPMVVNFEIKHFQIMGLNGGPMFRPNPSISISVHLQSEEEINKVWTALADGGSPLMALGKYDWNPYYGWVKDKYGMTWQVFLGEKYQIKSSMLFTDTQLGKASTAINLYTSLFPNSDSLMQVPYPPSSPYAGGIMYGEFTIQGQTIVAMDGPGGHAFAFSEGLSFVIICDSQAEIDHLWYSLIDDGGQESQCGWLKDKFGVSWQIIPRMLSQKMSSSDAIRSGQMMQALMSMKKLDIMLLENAYNA